MGLCIQTFVGMTQNFVDSRCYLIIVQISLHLFETIYMFTNIISDQSQARATAQIPELFDYLALLCPNHLSVVYDQD